MCGEDIPIISSFIIDLYIWHGKPVVYQLGSLIGLIDAATITLWKALESITHPPWLYAVQPTHTELQLKPCGNLSCSQVNSLFLQDPAQCLAHSRCVLNLWDKWMNEYSRVRLTATLYLQGTYRSSVNEEAEDVQNSWWGRTWDQVSHLAMCLQLPWACLPWLGSPGIC